MNPKYIVLDETEYPVLSELMYANVIDLEWMFPGELVSSNASTIVKRLCLIDGCDHWYSKPLTKEELIQLSKDFLKLSDLLP